MKPDQKEPSSAQDARKPYVPLKLVVHGHFRDVVRNGNTFTECITVGTQIVCDGPAF